MRRLIDIEYLAVGMFVEADVQSVRNDGEIRHFLVARDAVLASVSNKRARLTQCKYKQVAHAGGLLMSNTSHIAALQATGLASVTINTDKGADLPNDQEAEAECFLDVLEIPEEGDALSARPTPKQNALSSAARRNFGPTQKAWMKMDVDDSGREAVLQVLSFGGDASLGADDVVQALDEHYGIRVGLDREMIEKLAAQAAAAPQRVIRGHFPLAHMQPPTGGDGSTRYAFLDGVAPGNIDYGGLKTALALMSLDEVLAQRPRVRVVVPGERLAVSGRDKGQHKPGQDIFGRVLDKKQDDLVAGTNVRVLGNNYVAQIYGYVCLLDGEISVLSPLWLSPDLSEAHFVRFPQTGSLSLPVAQWIDQLLSAHGIRYGIQRGAYAELMQKAPQPGVTTAVLLARGEKARPSEDARVKFAFDLDKWAGHQLEDGSMDFRERNAFHAVKEGDLLAELLPAIKGQAGLDIRCEKIAVEETRGQSLAFKAGKNVRSEKQPGKNRTFYAEVDGNIRVAETAIHVHEVLQVDGDLNYDLGHVEAGKDVYITGSVRSGFTVRAGGNIAIGGTVEDGVTIDARGDVAVAQGIVGSGTRVVALGNVRARFVHNSAIMARGEVLIGSYLLNAQVRAGGRLAVRGGGGERGGSISGGQAFAADGIGGKQVGSSSTDRTVIGIGPSPETLAHLHKIKKRLDYCDTYIMRAFRTLGLNDLDAAHFKALIERTPREKREPIIAVLRQLKTMTQAREKLQAQRRTLEKESRDKNASAKISIIGRACAGVEVRMGEKSMVLDEDLESPNFTLTAAGIRVQSAGVRAGR